MPLQEIYTICARRSTSQQRSVLIYPNRCKTALASRSVGREEKSIVPVVGITVAQCNLVTWIVSGSLSTQSRGTQFQIDAEIIRPIPPVNRCARIFHPNGFLISFVSRTKRPSWRWSIAFSLFAFVRKTPGFHGGFHCSFTAVLSTACPASRLNTRAHGERKRRQRWNLFGNDRIIFARRVE